MGRIPPLPSSTLSPSLDSDSSSPSVISFLFCFLFCDLLSAEISSYQRSSVPTPHAHTIPLYPYPHAHPNLQSPSPSPLTDHQSDPNPRPEGTRNQIDYAPPTTLEGLCDGLQRQKSDAERELHFLTVQLEEVRTLYDNLHIVLVVPETQYLLMLSHSF
jgi:hypothetical protein